MRGAVPLNVALEVIGQHVTLASIPDNPFQPAPPPGGPSATGRARPKTADTAAPKPLRYRLCLWDTAKGWVYTEASQANIADWVSGKPWKDEKDGNPIFAKLHKEKKDTSTARGFVLPDHAIALLHFVQRRNLYISVRDTGPLSLRRITEGYACKPHEILEKSLKRKAVEKNTRALETLRTDIDALCRKDDDESRNLHVMYKVNREELAKGQATRTTGTFPPVRTYEFDGAVKAKPLVDNLKMQVEAALPTSKDQVGSPAVDIQGLIGWWATLTAGKTRIDIPVGILRVGEKNRGELAKHPDGVPVPFDAARGGVPVDAFTGDYDLHDVFRTQGTSLNNPQPRPQTPAYDRNTPRAAASGEIRDLYTLVDELAGDPGLIRKRRVPAGDDPTKASAELQSDRYANVIQHGPQSYYGSYLKDHNEKIRADQAKLVWGLFPPIRRGGHKMLETKPEAPVTSLFKPDEDGIAAFCPAKDGFQDVYVLFGTEEVLQYYQDRGLRKSAWSFGRAQDEYVLLNMSNEAWSILNQERGLAAGNRFYDWDDANHPCNRIVRTMIHDQTNPPTYTVVLANPLRDGVKQRTAGAYRFIAGPAS